MHDRSCDQYGDLTDECLLARVSEGDTHAFDELYARYSRRLLGYFHRMLGGNQAQAQDFLQDLFVRVIEKAHTFDTGRSLSRWLFSVAHHMCCNEYRRLEVRRDAAEELARPRLHPPGEDHVADAVDADRFAVCLHAELAQLDEEKRSAFLLRHTQGLSIPDISDILGCPTGTVKSRLFYTTRVLAERLRRFDPHPSDDEIN